MKTKGRPSTFTQAVGDEICRRLSEGEALTAICQDPEMPPKTTVLGWVQADIQGFSIPYARARHIGVECLAEELLQISDDGRNDWMASTDPENPGYRFNGEHVQRSRLRSDNRKWLLSKLIPTVYGDKLDLRHGGEVTLRGVSDADLDSRLAELLAEARRDSNSGGDQLEEAPKRVRE
jgi:hypothetical protein